MPKFIKCLGYIQRTPLKSLVGFLSNAVCISCNIDSSWAIQENLLEENLTEKMEKAYFLRNS